ncbi:MAG: branched-chain amino acid ABC transporter permease [Burkholderiales bacterium]
MRLPLRAGPGRDLALVAAIAVAIALLPLLTRSGTVLNAVIATLLATLLAQGWNILGGFGGQFSFGNALFFGVGAYTGTLLQMRFGVNAWAALPAAMAAGGAVGALVGALAFRYGLKGSYFALVTLAFAEVFRILANMVPFTGGGVGLMLPLDARAGAMQFPERAGYLYLIGALVVAGFVVHVWLRHSRFGAWLTAVRDNEASAAALGVDAFRVKLGAIVLCGALTGAAGMFYVQYLHYIDPGIAFGPAFSVEALLGAIVGGMGTVFGPLVGAVVLHLLSESMRNLVADVPGASLAVYGVLLIVMVRFLPTGLMGLAARRR